MRRNRLQLLLSAVFISVCVQVAPAGEPQGQSQSEIPVIRKETRLVLVDSVVTDKHGNYIRDLKQSDFKVWEDGKEQVVKSFSYEADSGKEHTHYLVLFFDNSSMSISDQAMARQAAAKFVDANAGPNQLIAVAEFGGTLRITQNFTGDAARLGETVKGIKLTGITPNAPTAELAGLGVPSLGSGEAEFGMRTMLLALRTLAKNLSAVPGRKSVVLLTAGFPVNAEIMRDLTAAIDACNKANVAVYPVDIRGLVTGAPSGRIGLAPAPRLVYATLRYSENPQPDLLRVQRSGGTVGGGGHGGPVGGGAPGGAPGGTRGTGGATGTGGTRSGPGAGTAPGRSGATPTRVNPNYPTLNPLYRPRTIVPQFPTTASDNQQIMYMLAQGTGGFVILNTNDMLGGIEKIAREQNEYYVLGYEPPEAREGTCHSLRVHVDRGGATLRSRSGYCNVKPPDILAGVPLGRELEARMNAVQPGTIQASMHAPFFYVSSNVARVNLALDIPPNSFEFKNDKGKFRAALDVLGIASTDDSSIAARFSDTVELAFDSKKELEQFLSKPFHYEKQFEIAPGHYTLKVAFRSGPEHFGKIESPLNLDAYDRKRLTLSDIALSHEFHRVAADEVQLDAALLQDRTPLVAMGTEVVPAGTYHFHKNQPAAIYVEVYEPLLLESNPPKVGLHVIVVDVKSGKSKIDVGYFDTEHAMHAGNPVIPLVVRLPLEQLEPGQYVLLLKALDSAGNGSQARQAQFEVE